MEDLEHPDPPPGPPAGLVLDYRGPTGPTHQPAPRGDPHRFLVVGFVALIATCTIAGFVVNWLHWDKGNKDYTTWYDAGHKFMTGGDLYTGDVNSKPGADTFEFMYPPSCALLLAPICVAGLQPMAAVMVLVNSAAWAFCALAAVYLVAGRALRQPPALYVIPVAGTVTYVWATYILGQPNLVLLALMLGAFVCLRRGGHWRWLAGVLVAVAAGIKAFPVAALVYLVWRRQWRAAAATVFALALLLVGLPALVRGPSRAVADVRTWADGMLFKYDKTGIGQRASRGYSWKNQSLLAVTHRLLRQVDADMRGPEAGSKRAAREHREVKAGDDDVLFVNVADLSFRQINFVILGATLVLGLVYIWAMPRRPRRTPATDAVEWAMLLLLILVLSPYSFGYFNTWMLYPLAVLAYLCHVAPPASGERGLLVGGLVAVLVLLALTLPVPGFQYAQAVGNVMWAQLLLFGLFVWVLRRGRETSRPAEPVRAGPARTAVG